MPSIHIDQLSHVGATTDDMAIPVKSPGMAGPGRLDLGDLPGYVAGAMSAGAGGLPVDPRAAPYGALWNNTGDDGPAINAASAAALAAGTYVRLPAGTARIVTPIVYSVPLVGAEGNDLNATSPLMTILNGPGVASGHGIIEVTDVNKQPVIRNLCVKGAPSGAVGIKFPAYIIRYHLERVLARQCDVGFDLNGYIGVLIDCFASGCTTRGARFTTANNVTWIGGELQGMTGGTSVAIEVLSAIVFDLRGVAIEANAATGLLVREGVQSLNVDGCYFEQQPTHMDLGTVAAGGGAAANTLSTCLQKARIQGSCFNIAAGVKGKVVTGNIDRFAFKNNSGVSAIDLGQYTRSRDIDPLFALVSGSNTKFTATLRTGTAAHAGVPVRSMVPNPDFVTGARGFSKLDQLNGAVFSSGVDGTAGAQCGRIDFTSGGGTSPRCKFHFLRQTWLAANMAGKRLHASAWFYIPNVTEFSAPSQVDAYPNFMISYTDDAVETRTGGAIVETSYSAAGDIVGRWHFAHVYADIVNDGSTLAAFNISIYPSGVATPGTCWVAFRGLAAWISDTPSLQGIAEAQEGRIDWDRRFGWPEGENLVIIGEGQPQTDTSIGYSVGDRCLRSAMFYGGPKSWVLRLAGVSGTSAGTWILESQCGIGRSTTANRITGLSTYDHGLRYDDTTLAASGLPIEWGAGGTKWVRLSDATDA